MKSTVLMGLAGGLAVVDVDFVAVGLVVFFDGFAGHRQGDDQSQLRCGGGTSIQYRSGHHGAPSCVVVDHPGKASGKPASKPKESISGNGVSEKYRTLVIAFRLRDCAI
ncbi:hypothetical protein IC757_00910 [Wenzhouxiangella sp. AB-CW3]|uniref:hypothetical protein n=1 Tax=Wenzhouxiangella sp. AB-CW3 TaxID=2771012 RepID=UPI00168A731B|nr:hypothetical protein [Wenzhouxiangella sp. AB-CW3]QOC22757.1 hypothetical protein IC757_00910 [Wenzhouxiangella sp. AB-CW3]